MSGIVLLFSAREWRINSEISSSSEIKPSLAAVNHALGKPRLPYSNSGSSSSCRSESPISADGRAGTFPCQSDSPFPREQRSAALRGGTTIGIGRLLTARAPNPARRGHRHRRPAPGRKLPSPAAGHRARWRARRLSGLGTVGRGGSLTSSPGDSPKLSRSGRARPESQPPNWLGRSRCAVTRGEFTSGPTFSGIGLRLPWIGSVRRGLRCVPKLLLLPPSFLLRR